MTNLNSVVLRTTLAFYALIVPLAHAASVEQVIHNFSGVSAVPNSVLVSDSEGNLYGTSGFTDIPCTGTCGTVFRLSPSAGGWFFSVLYTFTGGDDGAGPVGTLALDAEGNIYGTTSTGGGSCPLQGTTGCGTVFELSPNGSGGWTETVLQRFTRTLYGALPLSGVVFDGSGNLYGTTQFSGATRACPQGCGTIFELTPSGSTWTFSVVHTFDSKGGSFGSTLLFDKNGNMFGVASGGGNVNRKCGSGCGVIFKMTINGATLTETVLYEFTGNADGWLPLSLAMDSSGNLFGTTLFGGSSPCQPNGCGTVFELSPSGSVYNFQTLHRFRGSDGALPVGIIPDDHGNLFGSTEVTGTANGCSGACGTVFKLSVNSGGTWVATTLHSFTGGNDGSSPEAGVVLDPSGNLLGTAAGGGTSNGGVAFEMTP